MVWLCHKAAGRGEDEITALCKLDSRARYVVFLQRIAENRGI
jgi:hypothetical protein